MERTQYLSRRIGGTIPDDARLIVLWWKVEGGSGIVFREYLEPAEEKDFVASLKGYGRVLQRREMGTKELDKGR